MSKVESSQIYITIDAVRTSSPDAFGCLSGWQWELLREKLLRVGISPQEIKLQTLAQRAECIQAEPHLTIGMGESVLNHFTGKKGIDKWHLSPLTDHWGNKFIPTYDFGRLQKQYELNLYLELALRRAHEESQTRDYVRAPERFHLNPPLSETLAILTDLIERRATIAVDIETGYGQINTIGFAWSPSDAIAINVLPDRLNDENYHRLWQKIHDLLTGDSPKIFQNFIYDTTYLSAYGIHTNNIFWDTMHAMKVLWPELDQNLGNVGRLYTKRPYWKDDGKVEHEEGKKKDWGNVRDWDRHYNYNAKDTTGTFEAHLNQQQDMRDRNLNDFFSSYLKRLMDPLREMCIEGIPFSGERREALQTEAQSRITEIMTRLKESVGPKFNPQSPKQVMTWLKEQRVQLPKKYDKATGNYKESSDASSLKKVILKRPDLTQIKDILLLKTLSKALSSYIKIDLRNDGNLSYSLNLTGTETLRFAGNCDPWGCGFNIQTIPREGNELSIKSLFVTPPGREFIEIDLRQAESRFVAYDSADKTLIDMLESGADVHTHVGKAILRQMGKDPSQIPPDEFKATWRQLGKKAGHGLNYYMKAVTFVETVFNELDLVITKKDAELITQAYYDLFPGIPRWHRSISQQLWNTRKLTAPSGWERYFYGRFGDDMKKEAYAWRPQHTIPWITNHLLLHLWEERKRGNLRFTALAQVHDSLMLSADQEDIESIVKVCLDYKVWHPEIMLSGGKLWIPTEVKRGNCLANMEEVK